MLDFNLEGDTSAAVADALVETNIPFVFVTGYGDSMMIPKRFAAVPVVHEPANGPSLAEKLNVTITVSGSGRIDYAEPS